MGITYEQENSFRHLECILATYAEELKAIHDEYILRRGTNEPIILALSEEISSLLSRLSAEFRELPPSHADATLRMMSDAVERYKEPVRKIKKDYPLRPAK